MTANTRYVPAEANYTTSDGAKTPAPQWGVLDTVENKFAPFGGNEELAQYAAVKVAEKPDLGWEFVTDFTLAAKTEAERFEWIGAIYTEASGQSETAYGAVDNELERFYPFSDDAHDPDARGFVASVAAAPEGKYLFSSAYTKTT